MGTQERIGYRVDMSERWGFPWERAWESEFDRNGNGNYSTGMRGNGNRKFPIRR
jgi:hypothetical protein